MILNWMDTIHIIISYDYKINQFNNINLYKLYQIYSIIYHLTITIKYNIYFIHN